MHAPGYQEDGGVALVVGATGIIGRAMVQALMERPGWTVFAASRSGAAPTAGALAVAIDCLDARACQQTLRGLGPITHVFYAAYQPQASRHEEVAPNLAMLSNVVTALDGPALRRVVLVTGAKYYGIQWGPGKTPMSESDARQMGPNFYYAQEDFLRAAQMGRAWSWTHLVPPFISGFALRNPMNLVTAIGVLAALSRALGLPLRFPGTPGAFNAWHQIADAAQVAAAACWAVQAPAAENQVFNVANGDPSRWCNFWPRLARYFDMPWAPPKTVALADIMPAHAPDWEALAGARHLRDAGLGGLVDWKWADYMFRMEQDVILETSKIRRAGFHACLHTEDVFLTRLDELRAARLIPT